MSSRFSLRNGCSRCNTVNKQATQIDRTERGAEAARTYIECYCERLDGGEHGRKPKGCCQIHGDWPVNNGRRRNSRSRRIYGYAKSTWSKKIKRDVRITTIYEGTSEIMELDASRVTAGRTSENTRAATIVMGCPSRSTEPQPAGKQLRVLPPLPCARWQPCSTNAGLIA